MKRTAMAMLAGVFVAGSAMAADQNGNYRIKGLGLEACVDYLQAKNQNAPFYAFTRSWVNGYLSAYNQFRPQTYDIAGNANIQGLSGWLDQFCEANPSATLHTAVSNMVQALEPTKLTANPKGPTVSVDRDTMTKVQQALKDKGLYEGGVDGLFGSGTQNAIAAFQRVEGLPITGQPDQTTLARLLQ